MRSAEPVELVVCAFAQGVEGLELSENFRLKGRKKPLLVAEVAISKNLFAEILRMIAELQPPPVASTE